MKLNIRPLTTAEIMYTYTQSQEISMKTGFIGHLRADMDSDGFGFYSNWFGFNDSLKTTIFKEEFDDVINSLRDGSSEELLKNRGELAKYCMRHQECSFSNRSEYGIRIDTDDYAYLLRLNPNRGDYNLYAYNYVKKHLDSHLKMAERGIRFITPDYKTLFILPDGGKIEVKYPDGSSKIQACRFIDEYHVEIGSNLYHICEFSERIQALNGKVTPYIEQEEK